jgi:hypothetical protein
MMMQVRPVTARAVRCGEVWVVEVPSLSLSVPTDDLEDADDAVTEALTRHRLHVDWVVEVQIVTYLHVDDLPEGQQRPVRTVAQTELQKKSGEKTA